MMLGYRGCVDLCIDISLAAHVEDAVTVDGVHHHGQRGVNSINVRLMQEYT